MKLMIEEPGKVKLVDLAMSCPCKQRRQGRLLIIADENKKIALFTINKHRLTYNTIAP